MTIEYRGHTIEVFGGDIIITGPHAGFGDAVLKEEGLSLEDCAKRQIDRLIAAKEEDSDE